MMWEQEPNLFGPDECMDYEIAGNLEEAFSTVLKRCEQIIDRAIKKVDRLLVENRHHRKMIERKLLGLKR